MFKESSLLHFWPIEIRHTSERIGKETTAERAAPES